jgi:hypothetical protein
VYPSSGAPPGKRLGKVVGLLSFAETVRSSVGGGPRVQTAIVVWHETEQIFSLDQEQEPFWQVVDCFALERSFSGPLGKDLADDCYAMENSSSGPLGKDLLACSKTRVESTMLAPWIDVAEGAGRCAQRVIMSGIVTFRGRKLGFSGRFLTQLVIG